MRISSKAEQTKNITIKINSAKPQEKSAKKSGKRSGRNAEEKITAQEGLDAIEVEAQRIKADKIQKWA
jgi:hypothetical protein